MYSLIAISYVKELLIIMLPIFVFIDVFGIVGEISIGVDFIADYFFTQHSLYSFLCFIYIVQQIVLTSLEERIPNSNRDSSNDSNCGRYITKTVSLMVVPSTTFVLYFVVHSPILSFNHLINEYSFFWICNVSIKLDIRCLL